MSEMIERGARAIDPDAPVSIRIWPPLLEVIDKAAAELGVTRHGMILLALKQGMVDYARSSAARRDIVVSTLERAAKSVSAAKPKPIKSRLKGEWKAP